MSSLQTLMEMGFSEHASKKALSATGGNDIEKAAEWLLAHADDPGINDDPHASVPECTKGSGDEEKTEEGVDNDAQEVETVKSIKCDDCGKLFCTSEEVEYHAIKSGHENFSESTEERRPLTEEEKELKKREMAEKIKERRKEREKQEEQECREREKKRIQMGQAIAQRKRAMEEQELKKIAENRRREKMEDKLARQRVKDQIERDRQERKEMEAKKATEVPAVSSAPAAQATTAAPSVQKKEYSTTRIQIRLPTGAPLVQEFRAKESLSAVRLWISINRHDGVPVDAPLKLSMSFPRRTFTDEDMEKPLDALGLVPSAVLMVSS